MSEQAQEPTMEEILASIRRIISEDDAPPSEDAKAGDQPLAAEPVAEAAPEPAPEPVAAAPEPEPEALEDVLELTERVEDDKPAETVGDLDVFAAKPEPEPVPEPAPPPPEPVADVFAAPAEDEGPLVSAVAAAASATAFSQLSAAIAMPAGQTTLEDVVRELLKPLLKSWLDENLPRIVQAQVEEEVQRIARSRVR